MRRQTHVDRLTFDRFVVLLIQLLALYIGINFQSNVKMSSFQRYFAIGHITDRIELILLFLCLTLVCALAGLFFSFRKCQQPKQIKLKMSNGEWAVDLVFISIYIDKYGFVDRVHHFGCCGFRSLCLYTFGAFYCSVTYRFSHRNGAGRKKFVVVVRPIFHILNGGV